MSRWTRSALALGRAIFTTAIVVYVRGTRSPLLGVVLFPIGLVSGG